MKFTFIEKKMAPSDSLRAYAEKKVSKIDRLFRTESEANVTFSTERGRFTAEITIKNNGTFFRAHETTSDMYASVDSAVATIERQIRKNKTRLAKKAARWRLRARGAAGVHPRGRHGRGRRVRGRAPQALPHQAHERRGSDPPDESAGSPVLLLPQLGERQHPRGRLQARRRRLWSDRERGITFPSRSNARAYIETVSRRHRVAGFFRA